ncbi:MAG: hypothetical protein QOF53_1124 [Nocardioidaceae bacterium]|nr:hypothetical protein [Nocardioidaceae bacterium]
MSYQTELPPLDLDLDLEALERAVAPTPRERLERARQRLGARFRRDRLDLTVVSVLLVVAGWVHARGMYGSPARFDDEGTYTAYAWAVPNLHRLAHYTYWYAHPPLGQLQMALYNEVTDAFGRLPYAVATGRELALVCKLIAVVLMFRLARRLGFSRVTATLAVCMFSLSPLAVYFQRTALLDNLVTPWLLAAFFFAASPRRSIWAAAGSAACFAVAVLSKETALLFMPAVMLLFAQRTDSRNRKFTLTMFVSVVSLLGLLYPLYALIKNELWDGPGHVSLEWAIRWQLFDRQGSGSIFDPGSTAHTVVTTWLSLDRWSCAVCLLAVVPGLLFTRTRAVALAFAIQVGSLLRSGYLPYPFVIAMMPFAVLTFAGVVDVVWRWSRLSDRLPWGPAQARSRGHVTVTVLRTFVGASVASVVVALAVLAAPSWRYGLQDLWTHDRDAGKATALSWLKSSTGRDQTLVVDDAFWVDLVRDGHPARKVIWFTKLDVDKDVDLPAKAPWRHIDYVVLDHQDALSVHLNSDLTPSPDTKNLFPTLGQALEHGRIVASFGAPQDRVMIWRVSHTGASAAVAAGTATP